MIADKLENWKKYRFGEAFAKAFRFLEQVNAATPDGTYQLDGDNVYAMVQSVTAEGRVPKKLELHRKYIDIQYVFAGVEGMVWLGNADAANDVQTPYDSAKDAEFLNLPKDREFSLLEMQTGMFAVFFPQDAHYGKLESAAAGTMPVRKVVVKVAVDLF